MDLVPLIFEKMDYITFRGCSKGGFHSELRKHTNAVISPFVCFTFGGFLPQRESLKISPCARYSFNYTLYKAPSTVNEDELT